jgi:ABC-2 type transport system permease protein
MFNTLDFDIGLFNILYFLLNYLMGLLIFLSIFAAFGAMFDTPQDAQSSMMPVMMLIIIPFVLAFSMLRNPANGLAEVSSMLPFATILVMPARMTLIDVPMWQLGVAFVVNLLTFYVCIRSGAKIYRITILMTGKRPGWKEIYKWVRYNQG